MHSAGGIFSLRITFGENYPDKPPRVRFTSEMFHPNGKARAGSTQEQPQNTAELQAGVRGQEQHLLGSVRAECREARAGAYGEQDLSPVCASLIPSLCAVYQDGTICMDLLQDQWSPCHNICTLLTSVQSLLTDPNCASPANPEAAHVYNNDRQTYNKRVR